MIDTRKYAVVKLGSSYQLPIYKLTNEGLEETSHHLELNFVKGNIEGEEFRQLGVITENILSMLVEHLAYLNQGDLRNKFTTNAIDKIQEALMWIEEKKKDRSKRGVLGTYRK